ncbi:MAG: phosphate ABC transporter substrate-binding protein [Coxiella sp. (in: Bacteria)]|nr:MAG: phosphate ABC transporter substrate-binding protein [Coxiella sp. (in: g-proteobacteria)]
MFNEISRGKKNQYIKQKKVDLYIDSPYPALVISQRAPSVIKMRRWKKGISTYRSVIFVKYNSSIKDIAGLKGKMIAFEEPFSTASYFLPKTALQQKGYVLEKKSASSITPSQEVIGYTFSGNDKNTIAWVLHGKVVAGAMNEADFDKFSKLHPQETQKLRVLVETMYVPRHVVSFRKGMPAKLQKKIEQLLANMHNTIEGGKVLIKFEKTTKFDMLPAKQKKDLNALKNLIDKP